jgi:PAS domain S-box-containing protein
VTEKPRNAEADTSSAPAATAEYVLRLYVTGQTPRSVLAIENMRRICAEHLSGRYTLEVIDIYLHPEVCQQQQIIAAPTLIKVLQLPLRRIIGDLSNTEKVLTGLDLRPRGRSGRVAVTDRAHAAGLGLPTAEGHRGEIDDLRARLREVEETIVAIRGGEVDAVVVGEALGQQVYTLTNADRPYRLLIEQMKEGAITLSTAGLIVYCNDGFASLLGKRSGQISGTLFQQFILQTDIALFENLLNGANGGRVVLTLVATGHTEVPVNLSLSPLPDNREGRIVCGIVTDLRELRQSTQELADAGVRLADQIAVRQRAEALASALAHELNQPLAAIANYLQGSKILLQKSSDDCAPVIIEAMDKAASQAIRAGQVIQRLRDFVARGETEKRIESIKKLVEEASALALVSAKDQSVRVDKRLDPSIDLVLVDKVQVQQVLLNLLRNALEAMHTSERRELIVSTGPADNNMVAVDIADTGCGISPNIASQLFQPFVTTKRQGLGIGLSISRTIIESHGGQITVEPNPEGGTIFRFTLRGVVPEELTDAQ